MGNRTSSQLHGEYSRALIMKLAVISAALLGAVLASKDAYRDIQFASFREQHGKHYSTKAEFELRKDIFHANLAKIERHNALGTWKMGVNEFSDLTQAEFEAQMTGGYKRMPQSGAAVPAATTFKAKSRSELPDSVDWRDQGAVSEVKNQGQCGSCWAFCTTEMIESYAAIATGNLPELSTQQVTACTPNPLSRGGTGGCYGSIPQLGYTYIQLFGHAMESDYPYTSGTTTLAPNDQEAVMTHLAEVGPLAVAVYASGWGGYSSGVYSGCAYDSNIALNHAVQLVGYGTDEAEGDYWIVRNSWGTGWGEGGYIRLARDVEAQCGTDSTPMDGTACVGGPGNDEQHVCGQCGVLFDVSWPLGAHDFAMP